jgi:integrase
MARTIHRLTDREVRNAKKPLNDGGNLWVYPKGAARGWIFRFMLQGRAREMGLGAYPDVSLDQARKLAAQYREVLKAGVDPIEQRAEEAVQAAVQAAAVAAGVPTFTQAAAAFIRAHRRGWRNIKHARQWCATLKTYARPVIGSKPVDQIGTEDVLRVLSGIWTTKTETAKRVQGRLENILDFAAARRWRDPSNPARWRGHLDKLLPKPGKVARVEHHPAMPYFEVPGFVAELAARDGVSALALRFLILTACRTGEVVGAQWSEVDLDAGVWTVPASRMKANREHRVPLSPAALEVLRALPRVAGNPYCFVGARYGRPVSNMAMLQQMRGMGYGVGGDRGDYVPHGFRSAFRDWAGEVSSFPRDVCEMALAHVIENKVEAAYRRGDLFEKRRAMMEAWADWCTRPTPAVAKLPKARAA